MATRKISKSNESMQGITLIGLLAVALVVILAAIVAINIVPPYMRFYEVKDVLESLKEEPHLAQMNKNDIKKHFERRIQVNSIKDVTADNLQVEKKDGATNLHLNYEVRVHVLGNLDAIMKFNKEVTVQ